MSYTNHIKTECIKRLIPDIIVRAWSQSTKTGIQLFILSQTQTCNHTVKQIIVRENTDLKNKTHAKYVIRTLRYHANSNIFINIIHYLLPMRVHIGYIQENIELRRDRRNVFIRNL